MEVLPSDISKILCKVPRPPLKRGATAFLHVWPGFTRRGNRRRRDDNLGSADVITKANSFFLAENYSLIAEHQEREKDMLRADAAWRIKQFAPLAPTLIP